MTLPGTLITRRPLGRYRVEYPTNDVPGFDFVGHTDDLEAAGRMLMDTEGASDIYDTVEKRYINPELEISCVAQDWLNWWWGERPWPFPLFYRLGMRNPKWANWTVRNQWPLTIVSRPWKLHTMLVWRGWRAY